MAEVLLARTIGLGGFSRHVVIKRIRVEHGTDQKSIDMFLDEARLVAALHHRNIVQVHDVGEEDGKYFFVMEYVHGRDTRELLRNIKDKKQQVPLEHVITIVTAAAAGLHYAHEQRGPDRKPLGIVHRDISPGNILLGFDGGVKVVDFGIAKAEKRSQDTQAGEMKGKVGYMSPEQCRTQPIDRRTDIFLLGIVLYELCTVRRLFKFDSRFETMAAIVDGATPLPSKFRKDIPQDLERIVLKCLAKAPDDRYQTADELRLVLEAFGSRAGLSISAGRLSDYLKEQFGEVPEPWHDGDEVPPPPPEIIERIRASSQNIAIARDSQPALAKPADKAPPAIAKPADTKTTQPELEAIKAAKPVIPGEPAGPESHETPWAWPTAPSSGSTKWLWIIGTLLAAAGAVVLWMFAFGADDKPAASAASGSDVPVVVEEPANAAAAPAVAEDAGALQAAVDDAAVEATTDAAGEHVVDQAVATSDANEAGSAGGSADGSAVAAVEPRPAVKPTKPQRPKPVKQRPRPAVKPKPDKVDKPDQPDEKPQDLDSPFPD